MDAVLHKDVMNAAVSINPQLNFYPKLCLGLRLKVLEIMVSVQTCRLCQTILAFLSDPNMFGSDIWLST